MKKILAVLSVAFTLHAGSAFAQAAPAVDPAAAAAVREMLASMHYRDVTMAAFRQLGQTVPSMIREQVSTQISSEPGMTPEKKAEGLKKLEAELPRLTASVNRVLTDPTLVDEMLEGMVPLYARNFTVDEIRQIAAFYQTPAGQKTLQKMPVLMNEGMMMGQRLVAPRIQKMMEELMRDGGKP